ncbi:MAG: PASTA domain-containing protein [Oscillospiraceae bacterium]|nr:PASTA domain-containing protein [Oscillospiraceae bacterium]
MNIKMKMAFISASIFLMLAAAAGIIIIGRSGADYEEKLETAGIYLKNRDYDNAIAIYNSIISENDSCAEAYAGLSEAYFEKDRADKAFEILERGARNTDQDEIIMDKMNELFPDGMYADASEESGNGFDEENEDGFEDDNAAVTDVPQTEDSFGEISETEEITVTTVPEESETESETTTVPTTAATTVPTTAATTVPTTAAPVVVTTAPPVVTTAATTPATTVQTTTVTTTVTTTEMLRDVSVADLTRMSLDEAYAWCSKNNLILSVVGTEDDSAEILSQSPAPNSVVKENSTVIAVLAE